MIAIVNTKKIKNDLCEYEVRINQKVICTFQHKRMNGLGMCLMEASKAVEKQKWTEGYNAYLQGLKENEQKI